MIRYGIRHTTRFTYDADVSESVMELRMQPASEGPQQCLQFELQVEPRTRVFAYTDSLGNAVHHFDLPGRHHELSITARALVQIENPAPLPEALPHDSWAGVDGWANDGDDWEFRQPSRYVAWSDPLLALADSMGPLAGRAHDPLTTARKTMTVIYERFEYAPKTTRVDSNVDDALVSRKGVCQDFTHVMIAVLRRFGLPSRYVSGYIAPAGDDRSKAMSLATHAWVEVRLPLLGWIGLDPTNNIEAGPRHVRVGIGRDYADVPPTRGVFKGIAASTLAVAVELKEAAALPPIAPASIEASWVSQASPAIAENRWQKQRQQQQ